MAAARAAGARLAVLACGVLFTFTVSPAIRALGAAVPLPPDEAPRFAARDLAGPSPDEDPTPSTVAYRLTDLRSGRTLRAARPDVLGARVAPGSIAKIALILAALESGTIEPSSALSCQGGAVVAGRRIVCVHPDLHRPLTAADALAYSCNFYVASIAERVPRPAFVRALVLLGLRPPSATVPIVPAALGLEGIHATPDELLSALVRLAAAPGPVAQGTRDVLLRGLHQASVSGTAAALGEAGFDALAKTGTASMPGGGYEGLVVAVTPASRPRRGVVVVAPGGAGRDAAGLAAEILSADRTPPAAPPAAKSAGLPATVSVGMTGRPHAAAVRMPLEDYVAAVVAAEAPPNAGEAALDALAVTARTYAAANLGRHRVEGFDFCDLTHCQAVGVATPATRMASERTRGELLLQQGKPASVFYTASCGGRSAGAGEVWPGAGPGPAATVGRDDAWCRDQPAWVSEISADDLVRALKAAGFRGDRLRDVRVLERGASGRAARLGLEGLNPAEVTGDTFRLAIGRALGWQRLKSTLFDLARTGTGYRFTGRGSGHGVGLCAAGAARMAAKGQTARSILLEFFPDTDLVRTPTVSVRVALPAGLEHERAGLTDIVERAATDLAKQLRVSPPARVDVIVHPTVESYQRATGEPWWTAADTRGNSIHLIPLAALRRRGTLEATLRHELVHVLSGPVLQGRPRWIIEGLAGYLAGEEREGEGRTRQGGGRGSVPGRDATPAQACPTDAELQRAQTPGALDDAYRRARACVERALAAGASWREIR